MAACFVVSQKMLCELNPKIKLLSKSVVSVTSLKFLRLKYIKTLKIITDTSHFSEDLKYKNIQVVVLRSFDIEDQTSYRHNKKTCSVHNHYIIGLFHCVVICLNG